MQKWWLAVAGAAVVYVPSLAVADDGGGHGGGHGEMLHQTTVFLFLAVMYLAARAGAIVERWGLPSVLGELSAGILLINIAQWTGVTSVVALRDDPLVKIFPFVGVILLLFKSGLEEQLSQMLKVGVRATWVALIGMLFPFVGGFILSKYVFFTEADLPVHVFVGATLVATSVGITAKIFQDLGYSGFTKSIVIGAAVMDDVGGLVVLAVVSVLADGGQVTPGLVGQTTGVALAFLVGAIIVGRLTAPAVGSFLSRIHSGVGMKAGMALGFCAIFSYLAVVLGGLEPIVGAFAAGLVLDHVHFRSFEQNGVVAHMRRWAGMIPPGACLPVVQEMYDQIRKEDHEHVESLVEGVARFFVPLFFVHTGMGVNLGVFSDLSLVGIALAIAAVAIAGKLACGLASGPQSNRWIAGWAMVARGEVGLVFATLALDKGVFTGEHFAVMVMVVVISTFIPPVLLPGLIRRGASSALDASDAESANPIAMHA